MGIAAGLPKRWLTELFHFAPKPHVAYRIGERAARGKVSTSDGYAEFFYNALETSGDAIDMTRLRKRSIEYLRGLDRRHHCSILSARAIAGWGRARTTQSP